MPRLSTEEIRAGLTGPVASVATPFCRDGSVDYDGLRSYVDFVIAAGSRSVILTNGDSLYTLLTDAEVAEVTRVVVEHCAGRALVVAADRGWATPKATDFAAYCADVGADVLMLMPPDWARSSTVETFVEHYRAAAEHMPVMVVTNVFAAWPQPQALAVLERLRDTVPGVCCIKDDLCGAFARRMSMVVHPQWAVISGGQKQNHLDLWPYGCDGYFSTFIAFKPEVAHTYWSAIVAGDRDAAVAVIGKYDVPLFDSMGGVTGSFDAAVHGILELYGIAGRWRRNPYYSLSDAEMEHLADFLRSLGVL